LKSISDNRADGSKRLIKAHEAKLGELKAELRELLKQPLVARGVSTRYVTSGSNPIAHDMLAGECGWINVPTTSYLSDSQTDHEGMIGVRKTEACAAIAPGKGRTVTKENTKHGVEFEEFEEWTGIS
jgi:ATP-dependent RNA helicase DDX24/MAK5